MVPAIFLVVVWTVLPGCTRSEKGTGRSSRTDEIPVVTLPARVTLELASQARLGEEVDLICTVTPDADVPKMRVYFTFPRGVEHVSGLTNIYTSGKKGQTETYRVRIRFKSAPATLGAMAGQWHINEKGDEIFGPSEGATMWLYLIDEQTGLFGNEAEYKNSKLEFLYDPVEGVWLEVGEPRYGERNRRIIQTVKKLEPALTDSEALCLDSEKYRIGIPPGGSKWDEQKQEWVEEDTYRYYLREGWLKAIRAGTILEWEGVCKEKIRAEWQKRPEQQGRKKGDTGYRQTEELWLMVSSSDTRALRRAPDVVVTFDGRWRFRKHICDTTGLRTEAVTKDMEWGKARILATYYEGVNFRRVYSPYATTDDAGGFVVQMSVPDTAQTCRAYAVFFPAGPDPGNPTVCVTDPNISIPDYWKDPDRPNLFPCRENGTPTPHDFILDTVPKHLGTVFPDSFTLAHKQPESGAVNIYEGLLVAYRYLTDGGFAGGDSLGTVTAVWEPGFNPFDTLNTSAYRNDTIWIIGDTFGGGTDEWDDCAILHEYGHFAMDRAAVIRVDSTCTDTISWQDSFPCDSYAAYREGWPEVFSTEVLGQLLHVNTRGGIGSPKAPWYWNVEDPWQHNWGTGFQGGPRCWGAVTASLWDICDPIGPPGEFWGDTLEQVEQGFGCVWNISTQYQTPSPDSHFCYTIWDFLDGYRAKKYGQQPFLKDVLAHHRIYWDSAPPSPPSIWGKIVKWGVPATLFAVWLKLCGAWQLDVAELPDSCGYNIYRKELDSLAFTFVGTTTDTSFADTTVVPGITYVYAVTAYDSFYTESDTSNNLTIWVPGSEDSLATGRNNAQKMVWDGGDSIIYIAFSSGDSVYCEKSTDLGATWQNTAVGVGAFPTIALVPDGDLWMVWIGDYQTDGIFNAYRGILVQQVLRRGVVLSPRDAAHIHLECS
jgi:hypothetical protein